MPDGSTGFILVSNDSPGLEIPQRVPEAELDAMQSMGRKTPVMARLHNESMCLTHNKAILRTLDSLYNWFRHLFSRLYVYLRWPMHQLVPNGTTCLGH